MLFVQRSQIIERNPNLFDVFVLFFLTHSRLTHIRSVNELSITGLSDSWNTFRLKVELMKVMQRQRVR